MSNAEPLFSQPVEENVLGSILSLGGTGLEQLSSHVARSSVSHLFCDTLTSQLAKLLLDGYKKGHPVDPNVLAEKLGRTGVLGDNIDPWVYISGITLKSTYPSASVIDTALLELGRLGSLRSLVSGAQKELADVTPDTDPLELSTTIAHIATESAHPEARLLSAGDLIGVVQDSPRPTWTVSTLIPELDSVLGGKGLESGRNIVIGARGKVGKTTFMLSLVSAVAGQGNIALVMNFETQQHEFLARLVAAQSKLDWKQVDAYLTAPDKTQVDMTDADRELLLETLDEIKKQDILQAYGSETTLAPADIEAHVNKVIQDNPGRKIVLFVDYIQCQIRDHQAATREITELSRFYKHLSVDKNICVVYLTQLNRSGGDAYPPNVTNIASSDSISRDADTIILLDRPFLRDAQDNPDPSLLVCDASHTRVAEGKKFTLYFSGASQTIDQRTVSATESVWDEFTTTMTDFVPNDSTNWNIDI